MQDFIYRYPGSRPFQISDTAVFYGRDKETKDFFDILMVEKLTVLFSRSGMGKTSLINAGLIPKFAETSFVPLYIRLNNTGVSLTEQFCQQYQIAASNFAKSTTESTFLWEKVKYTPLQKNNKDAFPLIILDQFEEIFTLYNANNRKDFVAQLADLANGRLPDRIQTNIKNELEANPDIDDATLVALEQIPKLKILFAIRSDFLHLLDEISLQIPDILRSRIQLYALKPNVAKEAIQKPAQLVNPIFISPPFDFSPQTLTDIVDSLSNTNNEVESFQLQVLCRYIETKVLEQHNKQPFTQPFVVQPTFYGGKAGIKNILNNFYTDLINSFPQEVKQSAQKLVEEGLINENKRRRSLAEEDIINDYKIPKEVLEQLVNARLLRKEPRLDTFYYEISHDSLIAPILLTYEQRHAQEEREAQAKQQQEMQQKLDEQARKQYWLFFGILGVSALAILAIGALGYSVVQNKKLNEEKNGNLLHMHLQGAEKNVQDATKRLRFAEQALHYDSLCNDKSLNAQFAFLKSYYHQSFFLNGKIYPTPFYRQIPHTTPDYNAVTEQQQTLCFSPNAEMVVSLGAPDTLSLFKANGKLIHKWKLPTDTVQYVTFAHNNSKILVAAGKNAYLYDTTARLLSTFVAHKGLVMTANFSPNDSLITTNAQDSTQKVWQTYAFNKPPLYSFKNISTITLSNIINFSPNSKLLFVTDSTNFSILYNLKNGEPQLFLPHKNEFILSAVFNPNSTMLYFLHSNEIGGNQLHEWDIYKKTNKITVFKKLVSIGAFSPNAQYLAQKYHYDSIMLYNMQTGVQKNLKIPNTYAEEIIFSPDSEFFISVEKPTNNDDNLNSPCQFVRQYSLWDVDDGSRKMQFGDENSGDSWQISANAKYFFATVTPTTAKLWDLAHQPFDTIQTFLPTNTTNKTIFDIAFLDNNKMGVACGNQAILTDLHNQKNTKVLLQALGNKDIVNSIAFSPNQKHIATCLAGEVHIFDAYGKPIKTFQTLGKKIQKMLYTPQNDLITISNNGVIKIWKSNDYNLIKEILPPSKEEQITAVTVNIEYIAYATTRLYNEDDESYIQKVYLLPLTNLNQTPTVLGVFKNRDTNRNYVSSLAFSPNGSFLLSSFDFSKPSPKDTTVVMWQLKQSDHDEDSFSKILELKHNSHHKFPYICTIIKSQNTSNSAVSKAMFSPKGTEILSVQSDAGTINWFNLQGINLYEQKNFQQNISQNGYKGRFSTASFSPNGEYLVIGDKNAQIMRLKMTPEAILKDLRQRNIYKLTNEDLRLNNIPTKREK